MQESESDLTGLHNSLGELRLQPSGLDIVLCFVRFVNPDSLSYVDL